MAETLDFSAIKILLIGDVMIDHYLYGQINRISAEAPVPIVDIEDEEYRLGGAANVALNLLGLGAKTTLLTMLGDDEVGRKALHLMKENNLKTNHVLTSKLRTTSLKTRIFDDDRQVVRFDREDDADLSKEQEEMLLEELNTLLKKEKFNAIILQDYNKGVLTKKIIKQILLITAKLNIPVVVDPKEYNFFEYQQIDLFKPNLKELSDALKIKIDPKNINSLRKAAEELKKKNRFDNLMLTLGPNGIFIYEQNGDSYIVPSRVIKTADVSGAGDTVVSIAALGLAQKLPLKKVAKLANIAAGKVCKKVGVCPITLKDLK
ncbi:MAG: carbohydrate kinase [Chitinophagales bacterium]|jgi:rfaE bifunctional protein kinase chain/domain|nr:carbohydrate kinase [Chitinophagales bacterium]